MRTKEAVAAAFDGKASRYREEREREYGFVVQKRLVIGMVSGPGGRALEVGCGAGGISNELSERGYEVTGIDISHAMLLVAGSLRNGGRTAFACADVERLCFPDGIFDLVIGMGFLEYLARPGTSCREIRRVLRPGGEAIFTVPTSVSPSAAVDRIFDALPAGMRRRLLRRKTLPPGDPVHRLAPWTLDRILREAGLEPNRRAFCHFTMFPFERIAPRPSEALARLLEPLGGNRVTGLLGKQYLVRASAR